MNSYAFYVNKQALIERQVPNPIGSYGFTLAPFWGFLLCYYQKANLKAIKEEMDMNLCQAIKSDGEHGPPIIFDP